MYALGQLLQIHIELREEVSRVLSRKFKTRLRDSLLDAIWRPKMKNMRTGIKL